MRRIKKQYCYVCKSRKPKKLYLKLFTKPKIPPSDFKMNFSTPVNFHRFRNNPTTASYRGSSKIMQVSFSNYAIKITLFCELLVALTNSILED